MGIMYDLVFKAWEWVPWVLGLGTVGWIGLALLAPGVLNVISPLLRGAAEAFVALWKILYEGAVDILDNWKTVITAGLLIWLTANYITWKEVKQVERASTPTVKSQKVAPSQNKEKPAFSLDGWDWFHVK